MAEGQNSLGCRPILSSRGNKLCSKGAFESQDPCGVRVLLWQLMLDLSPTKWWCWHLYLARAFPQQIPPQEPLSRSVAGKSVMGGVSYGN